MLRHSRGNKCVNLLELCICTTGTTLAFGSGFVVEPHSFSFFFLHKRGLRVTDPRPTTS